MPRAYVGCAGWSLPRAAQARFPAVGSHLARYAVRFPAVEINSSFYRPHRSATYARWAAAVPPGFRFSVKLPRAITHERRLDAAEALLDAFLAAVGALGPALGCLLVQLPPSLAFDPAVAGAFWSALRARHAGPVAAEPRHATWFTSEADQLLAVWRVGRVAADPARVPAAAEPGGWSGTVYYRLHGSPRTYYSAYDGATLDALARRLRPAPALVGAAPAWCVFDNTALGAAAPNALDLLERLEAGNA
ncbi:hypothetical protein tb265_19560 [Gemmatimonadetes bacterium T265]|nr:hypothetical protein tb265_19560 [Gemmatimonadetes bacterium T265]